MSGEIKSKRIFLTVPPDEQLRRIELRGGAAALDMFEKRWIPLEEAYFNAFQIEERCDMRLDTKSPR